MQLSLQSEKMAVNEENGSSCETAQVRINAVNESVYADSILDTFVFLTSLVGRRVLKCNTISL